MDTNRQVVKVNIAWKHTYKNNRSTGYTTMIVRALANGKYRVFDRCDEAITPDGTGTFALFELLDEAISWAHVYGMMLENP